MAPINPDILGTGLRFPLKRVGKDFQVSSGEDLVFSSVPFILETQALGPNTEGEIPWDSSFGSQLARLKHKNIQSDAESLNELARHYVIEAFAINEPRLLVRGVRTELKSTSNGNRLEFFVTLAPIETDVEANDVRIREDTTIAFAFPE